MMKRIKSYFLILCMVSITISQTGCYGSFKLTNELYEWNGQVGSPFANAAVFFVLLVIPVYGFAVFIDAVILNTIEFWSENSLSMKEGEQKLITMKEKGIKYEILVERNSLTLTHLNGPNVGTSFNLTFEEDENAWKLNHQNNTYTLAKFIENEEGESKVEIFRPDGSSIIVDADNRNKKALTKAIFGYSELTSIEG